MAQGWDWIPTRNWAVPPGPGRTSNPTHSSISVLQSGEKRNQLLVSGWTTPLGLPPSGSEFWCDHGQDIAWHYPDQQQEQHGWLPLSFCSSLLQPERSTYVVNAGPTVEVLLRATGARRGRCLLPSLAQLHVLFIATGQVHRKQFCPGQNCQPERQQDISGTRTSLIVSRFSLAPSP